MLNYEDFKKEIVTAIREILPQGIDICIDTVNKVNCTLECMRLVCEDNSVRVLPIFYPRSFYEAYLEGGSIEFITNNLLNILREAIKEGQHYPDKLNFANAKDNIVFRLINAEQNKDLLKTCPHRKYLDLAVTYCWIVDCNEKTCGDGFVTIHYQLAEAMELTEEQLYELALVNTKRIFPPMVETIGDVLEEMSSQYDIPEEISEWCDDESLDSQMYVVTNRHKILGAAYILYMDIFQNLAERLGGNLYILPSSIHERATRFAA